MSEDEAESPKIAVLDEDLETFVSVSLTPEQREARRLSKKPNIDHLEDALVLVEGQPVPLFACNDKIVVERKISFVESQPWLDTRVYTVRSIDDETGVCRVYDDELMHYAFVGFKDPTQRFKLASGKDPLGKRKKKVVVKPDT